MGEGRESRAAEKRNSNRRRIGIGVGAALLLVIAGLLNQDPDRSKKRREILVAAGAQQAEPRPGGASDGMPAAAPGIAALDFETRARALIGAWQRHVADLRQAMSALPEFTEYQACRKRGDACTELLSDVLYAALHGDLKRRMREGEYGVLRLVTPETEAALFARLAERAADSEDVVERVSALTILSRENGFVDRELPSGAYTGLGERSAAEVQILLRRHRSVEVRDEQSAQEVLGAASNPEHDVRIRRSAIQALGHGASASRLAALAQSLPPHQLELRSMGPALASCGSACADTIARLMQSGDPNARLASYQAAAFAPPAERAALIQRIRETSPPASELSPAELAERAELLPHI